MKIKHYLYFSILIFSIVPIIIFGIVSSNFTAHQTEELLERSLQTAASAHVEAITIFCKEQEKDMRIISSSIAVRELIKKENVGRNHIFVDDFLRVRVELDEYLRSITIVDSDFKIVACTRDYDDPVALDLLDANPTFIDGNLHFSNVDEYDDKGQTVKTVTVILGIKDDDDDSNIGFVIKEFDIDFYTAMRSEAIMWEDSTYYLVDANNQIITAGTNEEARVDYVSTQEDRKDYTEKRSHIDFEANPKGVIRYKYLNSNYITYYSDMEYTDWTVMLSIKLDNYDRSRTLFNTMVIIAAFFCSVCAFCLKQFISRTIAAPIRTISSVLENIQNEQNYSLRVPVQRTDEMGELTNKINNLIGYIEKENLYERKKHGELKNKAERDPLTGVFNKASITERIGNLLVESPKAAVIFVDVDDFKSFNTNFGHNVGDRVLCFVADTLQNIENCVVGRFGGDEFIAIVSCKNNADYCNRVNIENILKKLIKDFNTQLKDSNDTTIPVRCCIGAAIVNSQCTADDAVHLADKEMYLVKNRNKNNFSITDYTR